MWLVHSKVSAEGVAWAVEAGTGIVFRELAQQKESEIMDGRLMVDHVHMLIPVPPKYSVSHVFILDRRVEEEPG